MRWPTVAAATVFTVGLMGCDKLPWIGGGEEETAPPDTAVAPSAPAVSDTTAMQLPDTAGQAEQAPPQPEQEQPDRTPPPDPQVQQRVVAGMDEPWTPTHTGTINDSMSRDEVAAVWGEPVAERSAGGWVYMYYRNGCEVTCGTFDVVLLRAGQVADAIVRGPGHTYSGTSSSPPGRQAQFTPPGNG